MLRILRPASSSRSAGRWRHRFTGRRGVDPLIATILLVAITVVLAAVLFVLIEHYSGAASSGPNIGESLVFSASADSVSTDSAIAACSATPCNFYNFSIQEAASTLELHNLQFTVQSSTGTPFTPTGGIVALNASGKVVGKYAFLSGWSSGGTLLADTHLTMVLYTSGGSPTSLMGDFLQVYGVSGFTGSESVHIL
jgi:flagellin-like protein